MAILLWSTGKGDLHSNLESTLKESVTSDAIEICRDVTHLLEKLRQPIHQDLLAILCADSKEDLYAIAPMHPMLNDVKVILILPDHSNETVSLGHQLRPRYLTFADENLENVCTVINAILERIQNQSSQCRR